jgi:hypothetical protein
MKRQLFLLITLLVSFQASAASNCAPSPGLKFFNSISGKLDIELSVPAKPKKKLPGNLVVAPESKVKSITLEGEIYVEEENAFRKLTIKENYTVVVESNELTFKGENGGLIKNVAPNGKHFTVKDILKAIEFTELKTRGSTEWFGGIDVHHVYLEGIACENNIWTIFWGS